LNPTKASKLLSNLDGYIDAENAQIAEFSPRQFSSGIWKFETRKDAKQEQENSRERWTEQERRRTQNFRAWRLLYLAGRAGAGVVKQRPYSRGATKAGPTDCPHQSADAWCNGRRLTERFLCGKRVSLSSSATANLADDEAAGDRRLHRWSRQNRGVGNGRI